MPSQIHSSKPPVSAKAELSPAQATALLKFRIFVEEFKIPPTYDDLGKALGSSKSNARLTMGRLEKRGYLERSQSRYHPFILTEAGVLLSSRLRREKAA